MSLRTRIRGFTAWVNLRLQPYDLLLNNVLLDLLTGTNMQMLTRSILGKDIKRVESFDGLTQQQKQTRIEWIVKELKLRRIIPNDLEVDCRLFAMRSSDHVFDLLWRLVAKDILFIWGRFPFLQLNDDQLLTQVAFKWTPEKPPTPKKKKYKTKKSLLSGFGASSVIRTVVDDGSPDPFDTYEPYPGDRIMMQFRARKGKPGRHKPAPTTAILDIVNSQLEKSEEGKRKDLYCDAFQDLADVFTLGALVNSFFPSSFATDVLPNDRWALNLILRTFEKFCFTESTLDAEDLAEGDHMALSAYFCALLFLSFKYRQCLAAARECARLEQLIRDCDFESEGIAKQENAVRGRYDQTNSDDTEPCLSAGKEHTEECSSTLLLSDSDTLNNSASDDQVCTKETAQSSQSNIEMKRCDTEELEQLVKRRTEISDKRASEIEKLNSLKNRFDISFCHKWRKRVEICQENVRALIRRRIEERFEIITVPRNITIADLTSAWSINLGLTNGNGLCHVETKEAYSDRRRVVIKNKTTNEFADNFTTDPEPVRKLLNLAYFDTIVDIVPTLYPNFLLFFECFSHNKMLKKDSLFLYQLFPSTYTSWQQVFLSAAQQGKLGIVKSLIRLFRPYDWFINCQDPKSGDSALHFAALNGHFHVAHCLLENGASADIRNRFGCSPLFSAAESAARSVSHLLIEWGCNAHMVSSTGKTPFESCRIDEIRRFLIVTHNYYSELIPKLMEGDHKAFLNAFKHHKTGERPFASLSSWCVNGSTLLHTAALHGNMDVLNTLLRILREEKVHYPGSLLDYKGATPLHRAKDVAVAKLMVAAGADVNATDKEGNAVLHVKCFGETDKPSDLECIEFLLQNGASATLRNNKSLLPIHCAAMQGRIDVIELLLSHENAGDLIRSCLEQESELPPSIAYLSTSTGFVNCSHWLISKGFQYKSNELNAMLKGIVTQNIQLKKKGDAVAFILEQGADPNLRYQGNNSALHYAAAMSDGEEVVHHLINYGANVDMVNDDNCSPLFFAVQHNHLFITAMLIQVGADCQIKNLRGESAFDHVYDYDEWISCNYFDEDIRSKLKAYKLKHIRDLVGNISKRVRKQRLLRGPLDSQQPIVQEPTFIQRMIDADRNFSSAMSRSPTKLSLPPIQIINQFA